MGEHKAGHKIAIYYRYKENYSHLAVYIGSIHEKNYPLHS